MISRPAGHRGRAARSVSCGRPTSSPSTHHDAPHGPEHRATSRSVPLRIPATCICDQLGDPGFASSVFSVCAITCPVAGRLVMPSCAVRGQPPIPLTGSGSDMITILRFLQQLARIRSKSLGDAELGVVWLLTALTFVAVGCQLIGLTIKVNFKRLLNSKDDLRAVRHTHRPRREPQRTPPPTPTMTSPMSTVFQSSLFQKIFLRPGTWLMNVVRARQRRRQKAALAAR